MKIAKAGLIYCPPDRNVAYILVACGGPVYLCEEIGDIMIDGVDEYYWRAIGIVDGPDNFCWDATNSLVDFVVIPENLN